ncbi:uncharacterized protein [Physeter macrocephalus]|uniref:Uncharacterized protein isoform X1 n=1 Tax=Physeter macrocephalus TaxID=9755 RepID=A0A9W2X242_PHYMC|nr:uncharacterized protein LOC114487490 isoform X1 [Physeter catodon]
MGASPVVFAWSHGAANGNQLGRCGPSTDEVAVQWKTGQAGQELHRYTGLQYPRSDEEVAVMLGARLIGVTAKHPEGKTPDEVKRMQCNHRERDWSEVVTSRRMPTTTRLSKRQKNRSSLRPPELSTALACSPLYTIKKLVLWDFPGGPVVKNPPSNAGGSGSIPGRGTKIPHASGQLSPHITATELTSLNERALVLQLQSPCALEPTCHN